MDSEEAGTRPPFGELLKRYRVAAGITQEELAERARLSARAVSDLERGLVRTPRKDTVQLLAQALHLPAHDQATLAAAARRRGDSGASVPDETPRSGGVSMPPLVGRAHELTLLGRHLAGEGPPLLLFAGEPGIGKSRLLREAVRRAAGSGLRVLEGGCQRRGGQEPYAPLLGAVKRYIARRSPAEMRTELWGCAWLVRLLPELAAGPVEALPAWTIPPEQERRLMFEAVARFLTNVAEPSGVLLVLDDLQWAGADALDLLSMLARATTTVPVRVIGAYRDTDVLPDAPLSATLADLAHAGLATHRTLVPLSAEEVEHLLDDLLEGIDDTTMRERLALRTGGVPFFVVSCAQALRLAEAPGSSAEAVPWDVAQSVRQRVAALSEVARAVLGAAAVAGRVVRPEILLAVVDQPEEAVLTALDAACRARLLLEEAWGYRFAHDVIREVVEADVGAARRMVLHRRLAEVLERAHGELPVELLAYHYMRSDRQDKALRFLEQAGDRARAQTAYAAAEGYYQELVGRLEDIGRTLDAARVREKLGALLHTMDRSDTALSVLERATAIYGATGEREGVLRTVAQIGWIHALRGTVTEGLACLQPILETTGAPEASPGLAAVYLALANLFHHSARYRECLAASERAADLSRAAGDEWTLARSVWERGNALAMLGRTADALPVMEDGLRLTESTGDATYVCISLIGLTETHLRRGEFATSSRYLTRALTVNTQLSGPALGAYVAGIRGLLAFFKGEWAQARAEIEQAVALFRQSAQTHMAAYPLSELGWLCLAEGRWDEASRYLEEASAVARPSGDLQALRWAGGALAELYLLEGRPAAARAQLAPLLDRNGLHEYDVTLLLPLLAWAYLELGDAEQAGDLVALAVQRAAMQYNRLALVDALRVQAMVTIGKGYWEEARRALDEGLILARRMPYPYAEARLLHVYGMLHIRQGEPEAARERLEATLAICQCLGAHKDVECVERDIAALEQQSLT